ncbi:MAG: diguanylate cyclase [Massilia sp.]
MPSTRPTSRLFVRVCLLVLVCLAGAAWATPTSDLRFKRLVSLEADELSILALMQDRQGFIWIGTHSGGLVRYNGYQSVKFSNDPGDPRSLPNDRVSTLFEDGQGRIWVGTQEGLARFNPATSDFTRFAPPPGPSSQRIVKAIVSDGKQGMWLATWGGLQHFDPASGRFERYVHEADNPASLASNDLNALALDEQGGLWVATWPGGLDYLAPGARGFVHYRIDTAAAPDSKLNIVRALHYDRDHVLWIGTETGLVTWNTGADWSSRRRQESPTTRINALYGDQNGAVWASTLAAGLLRWDKGTAGAAGAAGGAGAAAPVHYVHRANDPHSLQSDNIRAVMHDRGGMLWVASFTDGISLVNLNSRGFQRFIPFDAASDNTLPNNSVISIAGAPEARLWIGGNTGFSLFDPANGAVLKTWRADPKRAGALSNDTVYSLYQQPGGPLWVGTSSGLNRLDSPDGEFHTFRFGSIASNFINIIVPGADNTLWLGTGLQVIHYDIAKGTWTDYAPDPANPDSRSVNSTTSLVADRQGRVWMGSEWSGGGLDLLDPASGKIRHFRHNPLRRDSLADDNVSSLYEDAQGRVWVGTAKGVDLVVAGAGGAIGFQRFDSPDSVGQAKILAMRSEPDGKLWMSTSGGLLRLDPASGKVSRFTTADGLTEGFNVGASHGGADGALYFAGVKGITAVHPAQVRKASVAPKVAITDVSVFNRSLADGKPSAGVSLAGSVTAPAELTLAVRQSVFSLEFSALHYTDPARNRYAYRLIGFDRDWVATDAGHRSATYTNLNPGSYTFEVKAANEQGVWSAESATVKINILPPFWQTWWFRLLAALLTVGLLVGVYQWRVRRLKRRQLQLQQLVAERTGELEESNAKLATLSSTDGLTGITNRRGFDEALASEWRRAKRNGNTIALAMLDVDHFKSYNDFYGHQAGDQCLRTVASVIDAYARRTGDLVARYGGEEFALLAPATDAARALAIGRGICEEIERMALPHARSPYGMITISIGVASLLPDADNDSAMLVQQADRALYRAKQEGRNRAELPAPLAAVAPR